MGEIMMAQCKLSEKINICYVINIRKCFLFDCNFFFLPRNQKCKIQNLFRKNIEFILNHIFVFQPKLSV